MGQRFRSVMSVAVSNGRFDGGGFGSWSCAEAVIAAELHREELFVDPDLSAFGAVGVGAEAEVEAAVALQADGRVVVVGGLSADVTGFCAGHGSIVLVGA